MYKTCRCSNNVYLHPIHNANFGIKTTCNSCNFLFGAVSIFLCVDSVSKIQYMCCSNSPRRCDGSEGGAAGCDSKDKRCAV